MTQRLLNIFLWAVFIGLLGYVPNTYNSAETIAGGVGGVIGLTDNQIEGLGYLFLMFSGVVAYIAVKKYTHGAWNIIAIFGIVAIVCVAVYLVGIV